MNWEPARADHAIDRVTASILLQSQIDANTQDELVVAARKVAAGHGLTDRIDLVDPFPLKPGGDDIGIALNMAAGTVPRRVIFRRLDGIVPVDEVSIGRIAIAFGTIRYRRWENFRSMIWDCIRALKPVYSVMDNVKAIRLEYLDRFDSVPGGADHFEVLNRDSPFLAPITRTIDGALHSHCGWFEFESSAIRKLTNINIDVNDIPIPAPPEPRRKITILTLRQVESVSEEPVDEALNRFDEMHQFLKSVLADTITGGAADRISLWK